MSRNVTTPKMAVKLLLLVAFLAPSARAEDSRPLAIEQPAPDFALPGVDDKTHRLADFAEAKVLVVVFTCNHCPTAQAYEDRLIQMHRDYHDRGVSLVAVSPNDAAAVRLDELGYTDVGDSLADMKIRAEQKQFPFPYLYDGDTQETSRAYGVLATPQVFVFDAERRLRYVGRVDNSDVGEITSHDARNAIDALLAGRPAPVAMTRVFGCSTKWSDKRQSALDALARWDAEPVALELIDAAGVKDLAANDSDKLRLINLWATWCGPCVDELPELVTIHRMYRKREFELITISLDQQTDRRQALETLTENHVSARNYLCTTADQDEVAAALDPQWPGPIPYTVLIAPGGRVIFRHHGPLEPLKLKQAIVEFLGRTYAGREE